jgi:regulator of sigma E protease
MLLTIVVFVLILGLLVYVHEFGHFITARMMKMKVEEFGFGFPPRLLKLFEKNGTTYTLNWIPIGGFVKIKGESGEQADDEDSFAHKKIWQRLVVLVAGVSMNVILAWLLLSIGFGIGLPQVVDENNQAAYSNPQIQVISVEEGSAAAAAGLKMGDTIKSLDGLSFSKIKDFQEYVFANPDREIKVEVVRGKDDFTVSVEPTKMKDSETEVLGVGLVRTAIVSYPWYQALWQGAKSTVFTIIGTLMAFGAIIKNWLISGESAAQIAGPIGIAVMTGQVVNLGFIYVLQFAALLSINLAIINILPLPALDGGRVLFLFIEKIRRRPVSEKIEAVVHNIGFFLLMLLLLVVTFKDIGRLGGGILNWLKNLF